ncbi:MAG: iron ABC transporter permease [Kangiellaceae bacterium]|jgi:iron complex transport system permease protein|nr:iron ABC transporter permease [Kangiellaceae bacterium]
MFAVKRNKPSLSIILIGLSGLLLVNAIASVFLGPVNINLWQDELTAFDKVVIFELRLPRLILAMFVGALLSVCGAVMQGLFRNPLAEPGVTGVSAGAALGAVISLVLFGDIVWLTPIAAFVGGLVVTFLVWQLAHHAKGTSVVMLLLAGIAITALAGAAIGYLSLVADNDTLRDVSLWQMGSVSGAATADLLIAGLTLIILLLLFQRHAPALNALALGESEARHLGIDVELLKSRLILFCAAGVGVAVAFSGIIGFLALVVPHCVRLLIGPDHRVLIPLSALLGALLLSLSDLVARLWIAPAELPVGLVTALFGAPFFFFLLVQQRHKLQ